MFSKACSETGLLKHCSLLDLNSLKWFYKPHTQLNSPTVPELFISIPVTLLHCTPVTERPRLSSFLVVAQPLHNECHNYQRPVSILRACSLRLFLLFPFTQTPGLGRAWFQAGVPASLCPTATQALPPTSSDPNHSKPFLNRHALRWTKQQYPHFMDLVEVLSKRNKVGVT